MPDITLQAIQGGEISLSELRGKNVMLMFPRGRVGDHWCQLCHYQYAELVELESEQGILEQYNLEVVFALPYATDSVQEWVDIFPSQMEDIEGWKNPPDEASLSDRRRNWMELARRVFPKQFSYENGVVPVPFPILVDDGAEVSQRLGLFRTEWDRSTVEQNVPTIFILDAEGIVQFKYHSQTTFDRPSYEYLFRVIDRLVAND
jgi:peroxiredoxin